MSAWLENGRLAIQDALVAAFEVIDQRSRAELLERDRSTDALLKELQSLKFRAGGLSRSQQENERSKEELDANLRVHKTPIGEPEHGDGRRVLADRSPINNLTDGPQETRTADPQTRVINSGMDYRRKLENLQDRYNILRKTHNRYKSKLRQRVREIAQWGAVVDKQNAIILRLRNKLKQCSAGEEGASDAQTSALGKRPPIKGGKLNVAQSILELPVPGKSAFAEGVSTTKESAIKTSMHDVSERDFYTANPYALAGSVVEVTADEDCQPIDMIDLPNLLKQGDDGSRVAVMSEPASKAPVLVSERQVCKRKHDRVVDNKDHRLQKTKSELSSSSSSPKCIAQTDHFAPSESFDLEEDSRVPTPRKRKAILQERQNLRHTAVEDLAEPGLADILGLTTGAPSCTVTQPCTSILEIGQRQGGCQSPSAHGPAGCLPPRPRPPRDQMAGTSRSTFPLDLGIRSLSKHGPDDPYDIERPAGRGRLDTMPDTLSTIGGTLLLRPGPQSPRSVPIADQENILSVPAPRQLPHGKKPHPTREIAAKAATRQMGMGAASAGRTTVQGGASTKRMSNSGKPGPGGGSIDGEKTPIRQKPIEDLRPEDFKPNPRHNDGLSYVYNEVVRGREAQSALPGCTDLSCCGKTFRAFAEAERERAGPSVTRQAGGIKLLEKYLGDEAYKLGTMSLEEREEAWLQARTWELADKFGRHRQKYARTASPPGFWTVDFPNTQERGGERKQAEAIRRVLVHERFREAMRPGGRWLFRDEQGN